MYNEFGDNYCEYWRKINSKTRWGYGYLRRYFKLLKIKMENGVPLDSSNEKEKRRDSAF